MSEPKLHHYVPRFYLSQFTDDQGLIHTFDRSEQRYFCAPPSRLAAEKEFYTFFSETGEPDRQLEAIFNTHFEMPAGKAFRALLPDSPLSPALTDAITNFVALQYVRIPALVDVLRRHIEHSRATLTRFAFATPERVRAIQAHMARTTGQPADGDPEDLVKFVQSEKWTIEVGKNEILKAMLDLGPTIAEMVRALNWSLLLAGRGRCFLTSDAPIIILPAQGTSGETPVGLGSPGAVKYFPISPSVCLRLGDFGRDATWRRVPPEAVRAINSNVCANSERFVYSNNLENLKRAVQTVEPKPRQPDERVKFSVLKVSEYELYEVMAHYSQARFYAQGM